MSEAQSEPWEYEKLVQYVARLVHKGEIQLYQVGESGHADAFEVDKPYTADDLQEDVRAFLDDVEEQPAQEQIEVDNSIPERSHNVDWDDLWDEFGFGTPDAVGSCLASRTQLRLAIDCSEQNVAGEPSTHISRAVEESVLDPEYVDGDETDGIIRGYRLGNIGGVVNVD